MESLPRDVRSRRRSKPSARGMLRIAGSYRQQTHDRRATERNAKAVPDALEYTCGQLQPMNCQLRASTTKKLTILCAVSHPGVVRLTLLVAVFELAAIACAAQPATNSAAVASPTPSITSRPSPMSPPIPATCWSASLVDQALGTTLAAPEQAPFPVPLGTSAIDCKYRGGPTSVVTIDMVNGEFHRDLNASDITNFEQHSFPPGANLSFTDAPGIGTAAVIWNYSLSGQSFSGMFAYQGETSLVIHVTPAAPAAALESLANQLL